MMDYPQGVDVDLHEILRHYFYHGLHPGSFYKAVINNDLRGAVCNKHHLIDLNMTIEAIDLWMIDNDIEMDFLKDEDVI